MRLTDADFSLLIYSLQEADKGKPITQGAEGLADYLTIQRVLAKSETPIMDDAEEIKRLSDEIIS